MDEDVNKSKMEGVVCSGMMFDKSKLKFKPNYIIHLQISKQQWFEKVKQKLEKTVNPEDLENKFSEVRKLLNSDCYDYYINNLKTLNPNKSLTIAEFNEAITSHEVWNSLMKSTEKSVDPFRNKK